MAGQTLTMNDGGAIPQLGLGLMFVPQDRLPGLMREAVKLGYRHFDTATHYGNETEVGEGIRSLNIDRDEIWITTKLPDGMHGYDAALRAFDASEKAIGRIDLYLIHWPQPAKGLYRSCWKALVRLRAEKRVRSIGVANFPRQLIDEIEGDTGVCPAVNQIELHPRFQQHAARAFHADKHILTESWSPLEHGRVLVNPVIVEIAQRIKRSPAQVALRWHLQSGLVVIPKAADTRHLVDNLAAADFVLDAADMARIARLDCSGSAFGVDPMLHQSDRGFIEPCAD
ncbi:aldo/keto reductase [Sphingopyxis sp. 22461]|uniref:aldo/keto reductase n=1 Tax=Sphingopyxis sp. 22461 TaxID=3453923 RepID=UPI003F84B4C1